MSKGYIKLHRKIVECYLWLDKEPFDKRSAWVDLLLKANHTDGKVLMNNALVTVKRGQHITSEVKLSERWKWDRGKVRRFLKLLEKDNMILKIPTSRQYITIEIVNYNQYQDRFENATSDTTTETIDTTGLQGLGEQETLQEVNNERTRNAQRTNINKNDKNKENEKNNIIIVEIINYLNGKTGKKFSANTDATKKLINGRLSEGRTLEDFKTVVDKKCADWLGKTNGQGKCMEDYLRPNTLFTPANFENYLNEAGQKNNDDWRL